MENATKALLIAGGALIAIIIISLFLTMYNRVTSIADTQETKKQTEQIGQFNAEYEAFDKGIMYGVDVVTLSNKINNNNENSAYKITLFLRLKEPSEFTRYLKVKKIVLEGNNATINYDTGGNPEIIDFDKKKFECTDVHYGTSGRVSSLQITEK